MDFDGDFLEKEIVAFNFTDFRGEDFLEIDQSETRFTCGGHVC